MKNIIANAIMSHMDTLAPVVVIFGTIALFLGFDLIDRKVDSIFPPKIDTTQHAIDSASHAKNTKAALDYETNLIRTMKTYECEYNSTQDSQVKLLIGTIIMDMAEEYGASNLPIEQLDFVLKVRMDLNSENDKQTRNGK